MKINSKSCIASMFKKLNSLRQLKFYLHWLITKFPKDCTQLVIINIIITLVLMAEEIHKEETLYIIQMQM